MSERKKLTKENGKVAVGLARVAVLDITMLVLVCQLIPIPDIEVSTYEDIHHNQNPPPPVTEHALYKLEIHDSGDLGFGLSRCSLHGHLLVLLGQVPCRCIVGIIRKEKPH